MRPAPPRPTVKAMTHTQTSPARTDAPATTPQFSLMKILSIWAVATVPMGVLAFVVGMPSMVRTRFATPTIGREWMIGSLGDVVETVDPDGVVDVGAARWRARTNRATPVAAGEQIRVVGIDGVTLEVEPLEGAARDHRERHVSGQ